MFHLSRMLGDDLISIIHNICKFVILRKESFIFPYKVLHGTCFRHVTLSACDNSSSINPKSPSSITSIVTSLGSKFPGSTILKGVCHRLDSWILFPLLHCLLYLKGQKWRFTQRDLPLKWMCSGWVYSIFSQCGQFSSYIWQRWYCWFFCLIFKQ